MELLGHDGQVAAQLVSSSASSRKKPLAITQRLMATNSEETELYSMEQSDLSCMCHNVSHLLMAIAASLFAKVLTCRSHSSQ